jgi:cation transport ATPase
MYSQAVKQKPGRMQSIMHLFNTAKTIKYDEGTVFYRLASDSERKQVPNVKTVTEWAEEIAMYLALIGAIVSVAFTGGASTPAAALIIAIVAIANAALAMYLAYKHIARRVKNDTFEMDSDMALEVINVIASVVGLSTMVKWLN